MALSPNYGWAEPDNSSLVKNGAQDIRALGDAIDTSVWNVGYGQAGKNKIINGDFGIWQRGTSLLGNAQYLADRFRLAHDGDGTFTQSQETFTPGTAPVAGYESQYFARITTNTVGTTTTVDYMQRIENVRTFAGQTVTFSFWAKADSARTGQVRLEQNFGIGGSAEVQSSFTNFSLTTSWQRFTATYVLPSISGKTIGTGSWLAARFRNTPAVGAVIDTWGWQVEYGSKETPFQTASGGSPQAELAMCQRYYQKSYSQATAPATNGTANGIIFASTTATAANSSYLVTVKLPVVMRTSPTVTIYSFTSSQTGRVSDATGTDLAAGSGTANFVGDATFTVQNASGGLITAASGGFIFHYQAVGEL
jgi:hypothetical protein